MPGELPTDMPTEPGDLRASVAKMHEIAERIDAKVVVMTTQFEAVLSAVKGMKRDLENVTLTADKAAADVLTLQLGPMRQKAITLDNIVSPAAATSPGSPAPVLSVSPLEAAVGSASIHAITSAVPQARKENRVLSLAIAALIVLAQAIQLLRH